MDKDQGTTRKVIVFAVAVILLAGVPHFLYDRVPLKASPRKLDYSQVSLLPPAIGNFHAVNRWKNNDLPDGAIEQGAIYEDPTGTQTAQFDIMINLQNHDGLRCYITHGMSVQSHRTEVVQSADSKATFDIAFLGDRSIKGNAQTVLLIASTECGSKGCVRAAGPSSTYTSGIIWRPNSIQQTAITQVPLSITFETNSRDGGTADDVRAIQQFRQLISNFKLAPIQNLYPAN
jgi:hypothetical protein